ncbi:hypothetical protein [Siccibacter turicensis]|uniref:hypothetical protein n=1 Tax=Siccibacter turicensis TaxID=357233 RepID=UPI003F56FA48
MNQDLARLKDDVDDIEQSLYELHLRMHDMTARNLWHGSTLGERMAGLVISELDQEVMALYRRAAELHKYITSF